MITVLQLITSLNQGGAEMNVYKLVQQSDATRFRYVVISLMKEGPVGEKIKGLGIPVYSLGMQRSKPSLIGLIRFLILLRRVSPNIMQTWLYHADLLGLVGAFVMRVPLVWTIQSTFHHGLRSMTSRLCARMSGFPAVVVANSEVGKAIHGQVGYHPREWKIIPNGYNMQEFAPDLEAREAVRRELGLAADTILIGLVARFDPLKDHENFMRAASILGQQLPEVHFLLVGPGVTLENEALRRMVEAGGLQSKVHLLGRRPDITRLTAALDIATLSSYAEGSPNVVGEAMACEVPCVVTNVGDAATIVGDTGRVVPPRSPQALVAAWQEVVELGAQGRRILGRRARSRIEVKFALNQIVRQYEELYERFAR